MRHSAHIIFQRGTRAGGRQGYLHLWAVSSEDLWKRVLKSVSDVCGRRGGSPQPSTRGQSSEAPRAIGKGLWMCGLAGRKPTAPQRFIGEGRSDPQRDLQGHTDM